MHFSLSAKAYAKIVLHCCKYPHRSVNGVVVGVVSTKKDQGVQIQDAIPLFHLNLALAPMLEVALSQVETYVTTKGLTIVGYYQAGETVWSDNVAPDDTARCIASKVAENAEKPCLLMVNNAKLLEDHVALKLFTKVESEEHQWKEASPKDLSLTGETQALHAAQRAVKNRLYEQLVDFDNHLDNIQLDWTNTDVNKAIDTNAAQQME
ncbi:hypothetical protein EMCRGX_G030994 [Ephydatia muelleri]